MTAQGNDLQILALETGKSHLIEANAGTGKTYAIANLFLRYVLQGVNVKNLLVVTFTRPATDELRGRIRKRLNQAKQMLLSGTASDKEDDFFRQIPEVYPQGEARELAKQRLSLALFDINEAPIYTIHGFCQQALTDQAFSSGQSFEQEQVDDNELKLLAMQDWWRKKTYDLNRQELTEFHKVFSGFDQLRNELEPLLKAPAPVLHPAPVSDLDVHITKLRDTLTEFSLQWQQQATHVSELLLSSKSPLNRTSHKVAALEKIITELDRCLTTDEPVLPDLKVLKAISASNFKFKKTASEEALAAFELELFTKAEQLARLANETVRICHLHHLDDANKFVQQKVTLSKEQQGLLSFDDMIKQLHNALQPDQQNFSERASQLAARLAEQYPIILVDEFQDTDRLQYAIFSTIHAASKDHTLIMIGDPKQAIYGFRGGDIFTYMQARRNADKHWSLSTNWRSTPQMIDAINTLFADAGIGSFTYDDIPYASSQAAPDDKRKAQPLTFNGSIQPALVVQELPVKENGKTQSKDFIRQYVHQTVAQKIAEMLSGKKACIGDSALSPADIAILVRTGSEALGVRQALLAHGVRAVSVGRDNIWNSEEAEGLRRLLEAAILPSDRSLLRQAIATPFLNLRTEDLLELISTPQRWSRWVELMYETGELWLKHGFMTAFQFLIHGLASALIMSDDSESKDSTPGINSWLTNIADPERSLTNFFHLAELLQQASKTHSGREQLLAWMIAQQKMAQNEENELRLESDEQLVKIITMHSSKGLEFPVVFAAYLWHCRPVDAAFNSSMNWHKETNNNFSHYYSPWLDTREPCFTTAEHERLAEDIRLAYVALTRASAHCYTFFGAAGSKSHAGHSGHTALAWLLSERTTDLSEQRFVIEPEAISLSSLEDNSNICIRPADEAGQEQKLIQENADPGLLRSSKFNRKLENNWHISSFSSMSRGVHQVTRTSSEVSSTSSSFALNSAAGAHIGNFLHALLEHIKPNQPLREQLETMIKHHAVRFGLKDKDTDIDGLENWLNDIFLTRLDESGLTLGGLRPERQLHELAFDFSTELVTNNTLQQCLDEYAGKELSALDFRPFQGLVTGFIDLVFEHEGRYYLADYKSNLLGRQLDDYRADILQQEILNRRYDLQYLLYTLALHRHLRQRIPDYNYQQHFGGAYYLFLRGMTPATGAGHGVFFDRPPFELIDRLDTEVFTVNGTKEVSGS